MTNKKAQITIFIIIAILIVVAVVLIFVLYNRTIPKPGPSASENPEKNIEQCINGYVEEAVDKIIANGGYVDEPVLSKNFKGNNITYLCFIGINYARCLVIEPVFIEHLEEEIHDYIEPEVEECFEKLEEELEKEKLDADIEENTEIKIELMPGTVETTIQKKVTIQGKDKSEDFEKVRARYSTSLYDMAIIIQEIVRQESIYCNSEYEEIMRANTWVEIEKFQQYDDTVYTVRDTRIDKEISFALRNCVLTVPS